MIKLVLPVLLATAGTAGARGLAAPIRAVHITRNPVMVFPDRGCSARFSSAEIPVARIPSPIASTLIMFLPKPPVVDVKGTVAVPVAYLAAAAPLQTLHAAKARFASGNGKGLSVQALNSAFDKTAAPEPEPVAADSVEDPHQTLPEQDLEREIGFL